MTPFVYENEVIFTLTMILYIFAMIVGIICFAMSIFYKLKLQYVIPELVVIVVAILLFSYLSDGILIRYYGKDPALFNDSLCFIPTLWVVLIALTLLILAILCLILILKKRFSTITAMSVKEAISKLPVGLCFYDETGKILLSNEKAINDCMYLINEPLFDGNAFWSSLLKGNVRNSVTITKSEDSLIVERNDGVVTLCKRILHNIDEKEVYEIYGIDISREFVLKKEIAQKNIDLENMKNRLLKYGEIVTEITKEKENLAARIKVHSNLGSLIVRTKRELINPEYNRASLIASWKDIISLIFTNDDEQDGFIKANKTAKSIGVKIYYNGQFPIRGSQVEKIFADTVLECAINTVRHADGNELYVTMMENDFENYLTVSNNGRKPKQNIKEGGGLSNLRIMIENAGGRMNILSTSKFTLSIIIPKENMNNER